MGKPIIKWKATLIVLLVIAITIIIIYGCTEVNTSPLNSIRSFLTGHKHSYMIEVITPTCEHGGYSLHSCNCGHSYCTDEVDIVPHKFGEWVVTTNATIEKKGQREQCCVFCNKRIIEVIPQLEEHEHIYVDSVISPSCTELGFTQHTCTECGYMFSDAETAATGHSWSAWREIRKATVAVAGEKIRSCHVCGETVNAIIEFDESISSSGTQPNYPPTSEIPPNLNSTGSTTHVHTFGAYEVNSFKMPSESQMGEIFRFCECGYRDARQIPSLDYNVTDPITGGHICALYTTFVSATCIRPQHSVTCCTGCDYRKEHEGSSSQLANHSYTEWIVVKEATATMPGERSRTCGDCGKVNIETIPVVGSQIESYIDPRIEISTNGDGVRGYFYYPVSVVDTRTWGNPPSICITDIGGYDITYYKQDGTQIACTLKPVDGYINQLVIFEDGSYATQLWGDFKD